MPLDVVVPDLLLPPQAPETLRDLRLPHLERWVARARSERLAIQGSAPWLAARFGIEGPIPVAAVTLAADAGSQPGTWLRADPVHLQVTTDAVALHDASVLDIHRDEAAALAQALQQHFAADGLAFIAPHPSRWYVRVPEGEMPRTTPLEAALGRNVFGLLPRGEGRINWASAITETQMLLSQHAVNTAREASGKPAINSVWFWGEGEAPARLARPYEIVYANDAFARGLGALCGARVADSPAGAGDVDIADDGESVLVVLDDLTTPLHRGDAAEWIAAGRRLDEQWFARVPALLERFDTVNIVLPGHHEARVATLDASSRWRWFRSRTPLNAHA